MDTLALAHRAMKGRPWTPPEVLRAIKRRRDGMAVADIAEAHGRTKSSIQKMLWKHRIVVTPRRQAAPIKEAQAHKLARETMAWELAVARSERGTAPLLRTWPPGVWS